MYSKDCPCGSWKTLGLDVYTLLDMGKNGGKKDNVGTLYRKTDEDFDLLVWHKTPLNEESLKWEGQYVNICS